MCPCRTVRSEPRTVGVSPAQLASLRALGKRVMSPISASMTSAVNWPTPGSVVKILTRGSALACWRSSPSIRSVRGARPSMTARASVTISRETAGSSSPASQPRPGDGLAPQRVHQVRLEAVVLQELGQPSPAECGLERHWCPWGQVADQPQHRLRAVYHVLVELHRPVLGDYRHLGPLAVHVDADVDRHCRVSSPELGISHPERPATGLSLEEARPS